MDGLADLASSTLAAALPAMCAATMLPAGVVVSLANGGGSFTLDQPGYYQVPCPTLVARAEASAASDNDGDSSLNSQGNTFTSPKISDFRDPFYASTFPICYALAACTVTAYMLVIMLFITPRSFLDGGVRYLSRRSFTNNTTRGISIGGRPWLQKVATLTVAASLTVATASTFRIAQIQYSWGAQNAKVLQNEVMGGTDLKIIRVISDTFLWLAQAQTLIRLFPRQREKIIIKWVAALLITLDVVFSALNSFLYTNNGVNGNGVNARPRSFVHPVPTLSYVFQLSLGLLYAAWVLYYAIMKKRYAFYHPLMKNICLVAIVSIGSIATPVVFFVLDISKPSFTAWGDYVRWVGAAAASVVVWEWVERIEALEREVKKDGILGREVFHDDDILEVNASEPPMMRRRSRKSDRGSGTGSGSPDSGESGERAQGFPSGYGWHGVAAIANRYRHQHPGAAVDQEQQPQRSMGVILRPPIWPTRPSLARTTPVSRTDTPSATSTVYAVRYQAASDTTRTPEPPLQYSMPDLTREPSIPPSQAQSDDAASSNHNAAPGSQNGQAIPPGSRQSGEMDPHRVLTNQSSRRTMNPGASSVRQRNSEDVPDELSRPTREMAEASTNKRNREDFGRWDLRTKLEMFAATQADRIRERMRPMPDTASLPVTIIPAPARRGAALQQVLEEDELNGGGGGGNRRSSPNESSDQGRSNGSSSREASGDGSRNAGQESQMNPPLWPGVQRRFVYDDDDEYSYDGASMTETSSSMDGIQRASEEGSAPGGRSTFQS
jgi:hypothetical protein